jgi:ABC-type multidrug transport system fused ATPase/permease subunit
MIDFLKGLYYFWTIYLQVYLIDVVLAIAVKGPEEAAGRRLFMAEALDFGSRAILGEVLGESGEIVGRQLEEENGVGFMVHTLIIPHHRRRTAMAVAALYVFPFIFLHITDFCKCYIGLTARLRRMLQANLLRKFLYYDEVIRADIKTEQISLAMMRDIFEAVDFGYMKSLNVIGIVGKLCFALTFILAENTMAAIPLIVCPIVLMCFLAVRERTNIEVNEERAAKQDRVLQCVNDTISQYRLIADHHMRPATVDNYEKCIDAFHTQENHANAVLTNNVYLAPWLTAMFIGGYMIIGATIVNTVGGWLKLGVFLATINIFKEIGTEIQEIYVECMEIQTSFGPLRKIATYMNMPTDLSTRMRVNKMRRDQGRQAREQSRKDNTSGEHGFAVDKVHIFVKDLCFAFGDKLVLQNVSATFAQGKLHALVGEPHGGKASFMKLLGQVYMPLRIEDDPTGLHTGTVFVPPHLRILHACQASDVVVHGSFLMNIILNHDIKKLGGKARVRAICETLKFDADMLDHLDDNEDATKWTQRLSHTAFSRLALARAFTYNPEVLIIHKPTAAFNDPEVINVVKLLRAHVDEKGLKLASTDSSWFRRPRTVFFSSATLLGVNFSDTVHRVSKGSVQPIDKANVTMQDLE